MRRSCRVTEFGKLVSVAVAFSVACGGIQSQEEDFDPALLPACAGSYTGSYSGTTSGTIIANLNASGEFRVDFFPNGAPPSLGGSGKINDRGQISIAIQNNTISGRFDSRRCRASGTWQFGMSATGNWEANNNK